MLGDDRRTRLRYLAMLRRVTHYNVRAVWVRTGALVAAIVVAAASDVRLAALPMLLPMVAAALMDHVGIHHDLHGTMPTNRWALFVVENNEATSGVHRMNAISLCQLVGILGMLAIPSWVVTDLPSWARLIGLAAAAVSVASVGAAIFIDHTWYAPNAERPLWHELARKLAGPIGVFVVAACSLPAIWPAHRWPDDARLAVIVLCCVPIITSFRIADADGLLTVVDPLVRDESLEGRELVLREVHGNLSTQLRLLAQQSYPLRQQHPLLHDLAVSANSRLRETMALSDPWRVTSMTADTLLVAPRTLATAVGARLDGDVQVEQLSAEDRDLARVVLNDLVGNGLNAGADELTVRIRADATTVTISVTDDGRPLRPGVWKTPGTSSARLAQHLGTLGGSLELTEAAGEAGSKTVVATWQARGTAAVGGEPPW